MLKTDVWTVPRLSGMKCLEAPVSLAEEPQMRSHIKRLAGN